jgi:hypothetical protein
VGEIIAINSKKRNGSSFCPKACPKEAIGMLGDQVRLLQWPPQIKLVPARASCFDQANLLIIADCLADDYDDIQADFAEGKITLTACPEMDKGDCGKKLTEIIKYNDIKSVTVVRMGFPCCQGMEQIILDALNASRKTIPGQAIILAGK